MDLRDLQYFQTIAEIGHLGRAAKQLCRSQPALTKCIHRLEQALGAQLFERAGRGIRLTPVGEALLACARLLRVAFDDTIREIDGFSQGIAGHVRIGAAPTMAQYLLPLACKLFLAEAKDVTLHTVIGLYPVLRDGLMAGQLDLVVGPVPERDGALISHPITDDHVVVAAGSSHPIFRRRARMQDLLAYGWVLPASSYEAEVRIWLERTFELHGLPKPSVQIETDSVMLLPRLIAETGLLSFISRRNLGRGRAGAPLKEVRLEATTMRRNFGVIVRKDGYLSPAARRLEILLRTKGKALFLRHQKQ